MLRSTESTAKFLALFERQDGRPLELSDDFQHLFFSVNLEKEQPEGRRSALRRVSAHRQTLLSIILRHDWQKRQAKKLELSELQWMCFASLDVEQYFVAMRASFDGLANLVREFASKRAQTPCSFDTLHQDCLNPAKVARLAGLIGSEAIEVIAKCDWFADLRSTRDSFIHFGALSLATPLEDAVPFAVFSGGKRIRQEDTLMFNENLDDFELFVGSSLGAFLLVENALCRAMHNRGIPKIAVSSWSSNPAYEVLVQYVERLAERLSVRGV